MQLLMLYRILPNQIASLMLLKSGDFQIHQVSIKQLLFMNSAIKYNAHIMVNFTIGFIFLVFLYMYDNQTIKQRKRKIELRIKLNHNMYCTSHLSMLCLISVLMIL